MSVRRAWGMWKQEDQGFELIFGYENKFEVGLGYMRPCH